MTEREGFVGHCRADECGVPMLSQWIWNRLSSSARQGYRAHGALGLCTVHYKRQARKGTTTYDGPRRTGPTRAKDVPIHTCRTCGRTMVTRHQRRRFPVLRQHATLNTRELCSACYARAQRAGELERIKRSADEVLDDWALMRDDGESVESAAQRMGMTRSALDKALYRARKRGDARGSLNPTTFRRTA